MVEFIIDIETNGLNVFERDDDKQTTKINVISCISLYDVVEDKITSFCGSDEHKILEDFTIFLESSMSTGEQIEFIGFNIESFDINFIRAKLLINNIKLLPYKIVDLRKIINPDMYAKGRARDYYMSMGLDYKTSNGNFMPQYYLEGRFDLIKEHCEEDIRLCFELYKKMCYCRFL